MRKNINIVVNLAAYRASKQPQQLHRRTAPRSMRGKAMKELKTIDVHLPKGYRPTDKFEGIGISDDSLSDIGILPGDTAVVFLTTDIEAGDIVQYHTLAKENYIARYRPAPKGRVYLEPLSDEYETHTFRRDEVKITGRVLHFERDGQIIATTLPLRPFPKKLKDADREFFADMAETLGLAGTRELIELIGQGLPRDQIITRMQRYMNKPAETPKAKTRRVAPVVDLLCWKQSHPRPIKHCIVDGEGGRNQ